MLNGEKFKNELENLRDRSQICFIAQVKLGLRCDMGYCYKCEKRAIDWLLEDYKEPILTDEEKVIIKDIIKAFEPFDWKPVHITKINNSLDDPTCYLELGDAPMSVTTIDFDGNGMFIGMKAHKHYTLEELGL